MSGAFFYFRKPDPLTSETALSDRKAGKMIPTVEEAKTIAGTGQYRVIPVKEELYMDMLTPVETIRILKQISSHCFLLESADVTGNYGRYSFIGYDPELEIRCRNHRMTIRGQTIQEEDVGNPGNVIRKILDENKAPHLEGMPPFTGGLAGYFSYDYIKYAEPGLQLVTDDEEDFQDLDLMLFRKIIAFDHYRQKISMIHHIDTTDLETNYRKAAMQMESLKRLLQEKNYAPNPPLVRKSPFRELFSKEEYCRMVKKAKEYIYEGDIFQVVLSNQMEADIEGSLLDTYRVLRTTNPSPYMFYFSGKRMEIAGSSPETLVKLEENTVSTYPLAGTRKRGKTEEEDRILEQELLNDEKERAEHNMLVDLGRNDVGKISRFGSVKVEKYMNIERFSHVMHIGSVVQGKLAEGKDAVDAIEAILPAGTLSGAPKFRACQIIDELERKKRGIYGGAIGYLDFAGNMDVCIAIRIAYTKNGKVFIRSGAGIVADSVPEKEYEECQNKARAVVEAILKGEGGCDK